MASISEVLNTGKPPLGAALAAGVSTLSQDQEIHFSLYQRYVFPLDGMIYWIKVQGGPALVTTPGIQPITGMATQTDDGGAAIQVCPGSFWGTNRVVGGVIINPLSATDQGLSSAEPLFEILQVHLIHMKRGLQVYFNRGIVFKFQPIR